LITPFADKKVDRDAFERLIDWQIAEGTHGLVPSSRRASRRHAGGYR
jgi:dihydrodipicolinate synthase/N-acetylneuraminate lyase